jgi:hypothetical protein
MAMIRLVCSACGANLDVLDDGSGFASCGYCGAANPLPATIQPQPHYGVPVIPGPVASPWSQPIAVTSAPNSGQNLRWRGVIMATVLMWLAGGIIFLVAWIVGFGVPSSS